MENCELILEKDCYSLYSLYLSYRWNNSSKRRNLNIWKSHFWFKTMLPVRIEGFVNFRWNSGTRHRRVATEHNTL